MYVCISIYRYLYISLKGTMNKVKTLGERGKEEGGRVKVTTQTLAFVWLNTNLICAEEPQGIQPQRTQKYACVWVSHCFGRDCS